MKPITGRLVPLEWDNHFFSINSSEIEFSTTASELTRSDLDKWQRIQAKIPANQTDLLVNLQQLDFKVVDSEIDLSIAISSQFYKNSLITAQREDIPYLRQQAANLLTHTRFCHPWYTDDERSRFYAQWVENAVEGLFDDICLIFKSQEVLRGFVTLRRLTENEARIGLLAGPGVGQPLMEGALSWCQQHQINLLRIATQIGNIPALRLYTQYGSEIEQTAFWLYR